MLKLETGKFGYRGVLECWASPALATTTDQIFEGGGLLLGLGYTLLWEGRREARAPRFALLFRSRMGAR